MDRRFVVPELLYRKPWAGTDGLNVVLTWPHFGHGANFDANGPPHPPQNPPDWGGGANVVLTWPHFGHGANFDANAVPQLPQNQPPPLLLLPVDGDLLGEPHDGHDVEEGDRTALQLTQVSAIVSTNNFYKIRLFLWKLFLSYLKWVYDQINGK
jgi:hypothetical protein